MVDGLTYTVCSAFLQGSSHHDILYLDLDQDLRPPAHLQYQEGALCQGVCTLYVCF